MVDDPAAAAEIESIEPGAVVYDDEGRAVGVVSGFTNEGFEVSVPAEGLGAVEAVPAGEVDLTTAEEVPGQSFGEGYLMWRCDECGEMGEVDGGPPERCPSCGAPREALYRIEED